ncbi:ABC transporter ATP-binding protein [Brevibacillus ruminantium]|uniref:ABC transporter ATP-binding protein n=1 Tax=Brevibacillus ruminantium TaxID=2950604 RepID=A0ABY4WJ82_9BACL|nr:ABC transporter ATP-binding protein [Brevibacillus ruminantium]USG66939.1 ABC transporter ATP-binding protein [Brevibacillus ruminantium]
MIQVNQLFFRYPGCRDYTLREISFAIGKGEVFGFLGPSGAGKSTLQKILIGMLRQYEGQVVVLGEEISRTGSDFYQRIGVAFEFPNFYGRFTALENLELFRSLYAGRTKSSLAMLEEVGLEEHRNVRVSDFSKGMKMRLNLCRALLHDPDLLFLDEPTSGLDPFNAKMVKSLILQKKAAGKTVLITTHNMQAAEELCDRIAFVVDGKIVLMDTPRNLKLRNGEPKLHVEYRRSGVLLREEFSLKGIGHNPVFLETLRKQSVETIHTAEASLEDVFVRATGRSLE